MAATATILKIYFDLNRIDLTLDRKYQGDLQIKIAKNCSDGDFKLAFLTNWSR